MNTTPQTSVQATQTAASSKPPAQGAPMKPHDPIVGAVMDVDSIMRKLAARAGSGRDKTFKMGEIATALKRKVIGQDSSCDIIDRLYVIGSSKATKEGVISAVFLCGPPGTGKTYIVKNLHQIVSGSKGSEDMILISGSSLTSPDTGTVALFGQQAGFVGAEKGGMLSALKNKPKAVVLFDEFEKAHKHIQNTLLNALNDGFITDPNTKLPIKCQQSAWFFAVNQSWEELTPMLASVTDPKERSKIIADQFKGCGFLTSEFINRINYFLWFPQLADRDRIKTIPNALGEIVHGFDPRFSLALVEDEAALYLFDQMNASNQGNRGLKRDADEVITPDMIAIRDACVQDGRPVGGKVAIRLIDGQAHAVAMD